MVREDIVTGLRNALERGGSMEQAKQSLVNSGYGLNEINEAANYLTGGLGDQPLESISQTPQQTPQQPTSTQPQPNQKQQITSQHPPLPTIQQPPKIEKPKKKFPWMLFILVSVLLILVIVLVFSIFFKDQIVDFFRNLF